MKTHNETFHTETLTIPMYSWWQILLMSFLDIDFSEEEFVHSTDPESLELSESITKYSVWQMVKLYFQIEPADV